MDLRTSASSARRLFCEALSKLEILHATLQPVQECTSGSWYLVRI